MDPKRPVTTNSQQIPSWVLQQQQQLQNQQQIQQQQQIFQGHPMQGGGGQQFQNQSQKIMVHQTYPTNQYPQQQQQQIQQQSQPQNVIFQYAVNPQYVIQGGQPGYSSVAQMPASMLPQYSTAARANMVINTQAMSLSNNPYSKGVNSPIYVINQQPNYGNGNIGLAARYSPSGDQSNANFQSPSSNSPFSPISPPNANLQLNSRQSKGSRSQNDGDQTIVANSKQSFGSSANINRSNNRSSESITNSDFVSSERATMDSTLFMLPTATQKMGSNSNISSTTNTTTTTTSLPGDSKGKRNAASSQAPLNNMGEMLDQTLISPISFNDSNSKNESDFLDQTLISPPVKFQDSTLRNVNGANRTPSPSTQFTLQRKLQNQPQAEESQLEQTLVGDIFDVTLLNDNSGKAAHAFSGAADNYDFTLVGSSLPSNNDDQTIVPFQEADNDMTITNVANPLTSNQPIKGNNSYIKFGKATQSKGSSLNLSKSVSASATNSEGKLNSTNSFSADLLEDDHNAPMNLETLQRILQDDKKVKMKAIKEFKATESDQLSFKEGDILYVQGNNTGSRSSIAIGKDFVKARLNGKEGLVPLSYLV